MSANNLPLQLTSFIGRQREIGEVKHLLATSRLLTLTGAGGCGKTRLAVQVAADAPSVYPDGVWLGELAALSDPALVPHAVASAVGAREIPGSTVTESLVGYLRTRTLLLVLDNCEHVVSAAAELVDALLRSCTHSGDQSRAARRRGRDHLARAKALDLTVARRTNSENATPSAAPIATSPG